ncbi:MAG: YceI family protein [Ignavibacteriales bacterium]|nr:YceI family protein [Ignavibacteriales bacterium]
MKNLFKIVFAVLITTAGAVAQSTWVVDNVHSNVKFAVTHLIISEVEGSFKVYSGALQSQTSDFADVAVDFAVDVNSINTDNEMRDKHLKSDDFFNAENYPKMTFKSSSWKKAGKNEYILEGDLTIRDVTKRVEFSVVYGGTIKDPWGNTKAGFKATTVINRFDYGLKWNALTEAGGATVGKDVSITLNLQFGQKKTS